MDDAPQPLTWKRVAELIAERPRGAAYQLAQRLRMNSSYFYRKLKTGGELTETQARAVREFLGQPTAPAAHSPPRPERSRLPVYGYAAASDGDRIALNQGEVLDWVELPMGIALGPGDYFVVRPLGSSMEPRIFPGETLVVRRGYPPARDKDVVIEFADGTGLIKTYKGQRDGRVFLEQYNPPKPLDFDATGVKLHAVAFKL